MIFLSAGSRFSRNYYTHFPRKFFFVFQKSCPLRGHVECTYNYKYKYKYKYEFRALSDTSDLRTSASQLFSLSASQLFAFSERAWQKFLGVGGTPVEKKVFFFFGFPAPFCTHLYAPTTFSSSLPNRKITCSLQRCFRI